jgi:WD40 repeat protein
MFMKFRSSIIVTLLFVLVACAPATPSATLTPSVTPTPVLVYLSDLEPSFKSVGFSELGRGVNPFTEDKVIKGKPITAHGVTYAHGLFAHAPAQINYSLNGEYLSISGTVLMHDGITNCGDAKFSVLADDREVFASPVMTYKMEPVAFEADLTGVQVLTLKVDDLGSVDCDWSVWGDPVLAKINKPAIVAAVENTTIPTLVNTAKPKASATPAPPKPTTIPSATPIPVLPNHLGWMPEGALARFGMGWIGRMTASPDGSVVMVASAGGVNLLNPLTGHTVGFLEIADIDDMAFSPDGQTMYAGLRGNGVGIWTRDAADSWTQAEIFSTPCAAQLGVSTNGEIFFTKCYSAANSKFIAWDIATRQQIYQVNYARQDTYFAMAFSPSDPNLMAISANQTVTLMEVDSGRTLHTYYEPNKNKVTDLDFSPDGTYLSIASDSQDVIILNAATAEEVKTVNFSSKVLQVSFVDKENFIALLENSISIESVTSQSAKRMGDIQGYSHVYLPRQNIIVLARGGSLVSYSLDKRRVIGEVNGFNVYSKYLTDVSGNGTAIIVGETLMKTSSPTNFQYLNLRKFCSDAGESAQFADNEGKYIFFWCGDNKWMVAELATMKVVSSFNRSLRWAFNTEPQRHPWADDRTLMVLLYENPQSSAAKYRLEVWDPTRNKKFLDVNIPDFQPSDTGAQLQMRISPSSKYLVIMLPDGKRILSYDLASGALVQNIKLNTPRPLNTYLDEGMFSNDDTTFFIRHADFVEAYSIESGALIQKISRLKLMKGNTCESFCPKDKNNFAYFGETKTFVNYYYVSDINSVSLAFDYYDLESGQKTSSAIIQLPPRLASGEKVDRSKNALGIDLVYMPPEGKGNIVVVLAGFIPSKTLLRDSTIYVADVAANTVLKSYTWRHTGWAANYLAFNNFLFADLRPDPVSFLFDISVP